MTTRHSLCLVLMYLSLIAGAPIANAQDALGTNMGIPSSSPPILWPRGMSLEALSPDSLYPNGSQFGLSNTSGGFGMSGSGPLSGVGLAQRSVPSWVSTELERPYAYLRKLSALETAEVIRSQTLFSGALTGQTRSQSFLSTFASGRDMSAPAGLPSVDSVLLDKPATTDAILRADF